MSGRPYSVLQFAVSAPGSQLVEPPSDIRNNGFATGTRPPAQWLNYLLGNVGAWIDRLRSPSRSQWTRQTVAVNFVAAAVDELTNDTFFANPARRVVAITDSGLNAVQASVRGDSWVGLSVEPTASIGSLECLCATNDGWLVGGNLPSVLTGGIWSTLYDPDGTSAIKNDANNWTIHTLPASTNVVKAIACRKTGPSAGDAAAITDAKIIFRSGPTTWANATLGTAVSGTVLDVIDTGSAWLAVTSNGQLYRVATPSGSWNVVTTLPATNKWRFASDGSGKIVAYRREDGGSADWYVSTDHGLTWGVLAAPFEVQNARRVRFVDGTWFCCSSDFPYLSESNDLLSWNRIPVPIIDGANHRLDDIVAIDEGLLAIGQGFSLLSARGEVVAPGPWSAGGARLPIADAGYLQGRAIDSTAPSNGQALIWDTASSRWKPGAGGGGSLPSGSLGSILVHDGTAYVELGISSDGKVLRVVGGTANWSGLVASDVGAIAAPGTPSAGGVLWYNSTASAWQSTASPAAVGKFLRSNGTASPTWDTVTLIALADANTWTGEQTFRYVSFTRAVRSMARDISTTTGTLALADEGVIRMTNASARTLTLFAPAPEDAALEWRIHDAARTADAANITIQAPAGVTLNGVTAGSIKITTKGGAVIVRVTGDSAWETVGL